MTDHDRSKHDQLIVIGNQYFGVFPIIIHGVFQGFIALAFPTDLSSKLSKAVFLKNS